MFYALMQMSMWCRVHGVRVWCICVAQLLAAEKQWSEIFCQENYIHRTIRRQGWINNIVIIIERKYAPIERKLDVPKTCESIEFTEFE